MSDLILLKVWIFITPRWPNVCLCAYRLSAETQTEVFLWFPPHSWQESSILTKICDCSPLITLFPPSTHLPSSTCLLSSSFLPLVLNRTTASTLITVTLPAKHTEVRDKARRRESETPQMNSKQQFLDQENYCNTFHGSLLFHRGIVQQNTTFKALRQTFKSKII